LNGAAGTNVTPERRKGGWTRRRSESRARASTDTAAMKLANRIVDEEVGERSKLVSGRDDADGVRGWSRTTTAIGIVGVLGAGAVMMLGAGGWQETLGALSETLWKGWGLPPDMTNSAPTTTFKLHTACKPQAVRDAYAQFFLDGTKEAYVVRHNFGEDGFFETKEALKMNIVDISDSEIGFQLTTNEVNWEWGFALKNVDTGEWAYEIGEEGTPLAFENCSQRYGTYFNRALTREEDATVEYVFGSCATDCSAFEDTSYTSRAEDGTIPACPDKSMKLTKTDDARLINIRSAELVGNANWIAGLGRGMVSRDTKYESESENEAHFILHGISPYLNGDAGGGAPYKGQRELKMVGIKVMRNPADDQISVCSSGARVYPMSQPCSGKECYSGNLDISARWRDASTKASTMTAMAPVYTSAYKGDARAKEMVFKPTANYLLRDDIIVPAAEVGAAADARRVILVAGSPCGHTTGCRRTLIGEPDDSVKPTRSVKYWMMGTIGSGGPDGSPYINTVRVKVYVDAAGNIRAKSVGANSAVSGITYRNSKNKIWADQDGDALRMPYSMTHFFAKRSHVWSVIQSTPGTGLNVGMMTFLLAPEMVPSLAENTANRLPKL